MQPLATEKNKGGDRGESGADFSMRVELAYTQLLSHPNYHLCGIALGAGMRAVSGSEKVPLRHTCQDTWFFSLVLHPRMLKSPIGPWVEVWKLRVWVFLTTFLI